MDRFVCVHGHFYRPPRENAWLEAVELQDSAYPYNDWNQRICAECWRTSSPPAVDLRLAQDNYHQVSKQARPAMQERVETGDDAARAWVDGFRRLGELLSFETH